MCGFTYSLANTYTIVIGYDVMTVGEAPFSHSASDLAEYVLPANKELNMVFQFEMMDIDSATVLEPLMPKKWVLSDLKHVVEKWQTFERDQGFWNSCVSLFLFVFCPRIRDYEIDKTIRSACSLKIMISLVQSRASATTLLNGAPCPQS